MAGEDAGLEATGDQLGGDELSDELGDAAGFTAAAEATTAGGAAAFATLAGDSNLFPTPINSFSSSFLL